MTWQGFYLSDHTAALNQQNQQLNAVYVPRPQQSLAVITEVLADAYQRQQPVTIQLKTVDQNNRHWPGITTLIHGYNANDIVDDADRFIPLPEIRNVST
ncbi:DNA-directed RNA polymerase subunit beta (plasmid) [Lacticaseibacillus paracasei]|uniref:DNA-directed RNA polymerase subunit beta n=1 Tax=Lacticaseibacillus paracasei TaxID=1597 RepID=UPI0037DFBE38